MNDILLYILIGLCVLIIILLIVLIVNSNNNKHNDINKDLLNFNNALNQNLSNLSNHINNTLNNFKDNTNDRLMQIGTSIAKVDEAQNSLKGLSYNVDQLSRIFNDKKNRGNFGEAELYSLLNQFYGTEGQLWEKQHRFGLNSDEYVTVDALIKGLRDDDNICVDSKFPLEHFLLMSDSNLNDDEKKNARNDFRKDVKKHISDISSKYIIDGKTINIAFMFLPSESLFAEIYSEFPDLVNEAYDKHVFITSPTTLLAYLTVIQSVYREFKKEQNSKLILESLKSLSKEFERFIKRNEVLTDDIKKFVKNYDEFNKTTKAISRKFAAIDNLDDTQEEGETDDYI